MTVVSEDWHEEQLLPIPLHASACPQCPAWPLRRRGSNSIHGSLSVRLGAMVTQSLTARSSRTHIAIRHGRKSSYCKSGLLHRPILHHLHLPTKPIAPTIRSLKQPTCSWKSHCQMGGEQAIRASCEATIYTKTCKDPVSGLLKR